MTAGLGASSTFSLGLQGRSTSDSSSWLSNGNADLCTSLSVSLTDYFNASIALPGIDGSANATWIEESTYGDTLASATLFEKCLAYNATSTAVAAEEKSAIGSLAGKEMSGRLVMVSPYRSPI